MKVIFIKDVKNVAHRDDVKEVSPGYALNFLFPQGLAEIANDKKINELERKIFTEKQKQVKQEKNKDYLVEKIEKLKITITARANDEGHLFGGITASDLAKILEEKHGINIDQSKIELEHRIKTLGEYKVTIKLGQKKEPLLLVNVIKDNGKK